MIISEISFSGDSSTTTPLICNTNKSGIPHSGGNWISPTGVTVGYTNTATVPTVPGFVRNRGPMVVRLWRTTVSTDSPVEGIYRCEVKDTTEMLQTVYVGLYNDGGGMILFV